MVLNWYNDSLMMSLMGFPRSRSAWISNLMDKDFPIKVWELSNYCLDLLDLSLRMPLLFLSHDFGKKITGNSESRLCNHSDYCQIYLNLIFLLNTACLGRTITRVLGGAFAHSVKCELLNADNPARDYTAAPSESFPLFVDCAINFSLSQCWLCRLDSRVNT